MSPYFYFCPSCATPYKAIEAVLPRLYVAAPSEGELIEKKAPHVWTLFWSFAGVLLGTAILSYILFRDSHPDVALLVRMAGLVAVTAVFASMHWRSLAVQLKRLGFLRWEALVGLAALAPLLAVNYYYHSWILRLAGVDEGDLFLNRLREMGWGDTEMILAICAFPALVEELAFRGLVQHWLQAAIRPWRALVLASLLFMAMHASIISAPILFAVGMLLGWTKLRTGSLYPAMLIHFLHNYVVIEYFW